MLHPVQCFSCGRIIPLGVFEGFKEWESEKKEGEDPDWSSWELKRRCCQANVMGWSDNTKYLLAYGEYKSSAYVTASHNNEGTCVYECK